MGTKGPRRTHHRSQEMQTAFLDCFKTMLLYSASPEYEAGPPGRCPPPPPLLPRGDPSRVGLVQRLVDKSVVRRIGIDPTDPDPQRTGSDRRAIRSEGPGRPPELSK